MSDREELTRFAFFMGRSSNLDVRDVLDLIRLARMHRRIETELTNGIKKPDGTEDKERERKVTVQREQIDKRMEQLCRISYGALTVSVVVDGREVYIP